MRSLSAACGRQIDSPFFRRIIGAIAALSMCGWPGAPVSAQDAVSKANPPVSAEFREPVTLASKDGVLEVRLTARQGAARLDTVATPVKNFLLFDYQVIRGTASDGQMSGGSLYPGADLAGFSGRDADRPPGKRPVGPDNSGLLQSAIHAEGRDGSDLPGANDLIAVEPSRSRRPRQSERQCRQRPAAHPGRHVQHLHLRYSDEYAAGSVLVSQPPARPHCGANLLWALPACSRSAARTATCRSSRRTAFRSGTCCCNTISSSIARTVLRSSTTRTGRNS